jgi:hypothetical protein
LLIRAAKQCCVNQFLKKEEDSVVLTSWNESTYFRDSLSSAISLSKGSIGKAVILQVLAFVRWWLTTGKRQNSNISNSVLSAGFLCWHRNGLVVRFLYF